ncbi:MAG: hypothetical protein KAR21_19415, partial [Spirochaetales bacterium]|nr:hypothetical protein [Spirochaetales bacterium]
CNVFCVNDFPGHIPAAQGQAIRSNSAKLNPVPCKVRTHWDDEQEKWYFSVQDIVQILSESRDAILSSIDGLI